MAKKKSKKKPSRLRRMIDRATGRAPKRPARKKARTRNAIPGFSRCTGRGKDSCRIRTGSMEVGEVRSPIHGSKIFELVRVQ